MLKRGTLVVALSSLVFVSCGPRDVAVESGGVSPAGAKPVVLTNDGERAPTCPEKFTDETALRSPIEADADVFAGKVTATLSAGDRNCFRIGAVVNLQNGKSGPVRGQVTVVKVEVIPLANLNATHAQAMGLTADELKALADEEIEKAKAVPFNPKGMVNITHFKFNKGSGAVTPVATGLITLDKDGERAASCPADFTDSIRVIIAPELNDKVLGKSVTATLDAGDRNCFRIGTEVSLQNAKDTPAFGKAKIVKVQIVPKEQLSQAQAAALGLDVEGAKALADKKIASVKFDAMGLVHLTYFEIAGGDVVIDKPTDVIPVIDLDMYKKMIPQLKTQLEAKLATALSKYSVAWEPSSLEVELSTQVTLVNAASEKSTFPAFRITFQTAKGNTLALYNVLNGKSRVFVMDTTINNNDIIDVEGSIISQNSTWTSVDASFVPTGALLYNESTDKATLVELESAFAPLVIDVTPQ